MKYFRDINGNVFAYETDGSQDDLIGDKVQLTDDEILLHLNPVKTADEILAEESAKAKVYLVSTDWYVVRQMERGIAIPADILALREESRTKIIKG